MKIHSVKYYDKSREWGYDTIHFSDLTLLVGVSGAGKTQILDSLLILKSIATRTLYTNGISWEISFSNGKDFKYFWTGDFELPDGDINLISDEETLQLNDKVIARRSKGETFFDGKRMPKLPQGQSLINIFREEKDVKKAFEGLKKIAHRDYTQTEIIPTNSYTLSDDDEPTTFQEIKESNLDTLTKLYYLSKKQTDTFATIKEHFTNIFRQVTDIKIELENFDDYSPNLPYSQIDFYIKEKGVNRWIPQSDISSGMLRTLLHISDIFLLKKGTVVLIDEFENSLGTNCINALAEDLMVENNNIQFIITSHHPYIINQIPYEYWKIVTRENGKIVTYDADEFNLGESHHERFMNLINLPKYKKGIVHA